MDSVNANWRKSTWSGGNGGDCVEVANWRKSTRSGGNGGECVEVADAVRQVLVRDTKDRGHGAVLCFSDAAWGLFTQEL